MAAATDDLAPAIMTVPVIVTFADGHVDERDSGLLITEALKMKPFSGLGFPPTPGLCKAVVPDPHRRGGIPPGISCRPRG